MGTVLSTEVANQPLEWVVRATSLSHSTPFSAILWNSFSTIEKFDSPLVENGKSRMLSKNDSLRDGFRAPAMAASK